MLLNRRLRVLGLDVGERRIGVAMSDPTGTIAQSLAVLSRTPWKSVVARVQALVAEQDVGEIVVGLPLRLDGTEGPAAAQARTFADRLRDEVPVPVVLYDERLSTAEAERTMVAADASRRRRRERRDAVAAALILQGYLDRPRGPARQDPDRGIR